MRAHVETGLQVWAWVSISRVVQVLGMHVQTRPCRVVVCVCMCMSKTLYTHVHVHVHVLIMVLQGRTPGWERANAVTLACHNRAYSLYETAPLLKCAWPQRPIVAPSALFL